MPDQRLADPVGRGAGVAVDERCEDLLVTLREDLGEGGPERSIPEVTGLERGRSRAEPGCRAHRRDGRRDSAPDGVERALGARAGTIDLVHEDERRHAQPLERSLEDPRLGLDALDRGDHEHGAVEHAEHPLDLGDEVGVARRVDQVDGDVADLERDDGGLDRDAALALELEGVGLGGAGVDAAELVDDPGGVEEPLGEGGLTGVDVGEDAKI